MKLNKKNMGKILAVNSIVFFTIVMGLFVFGEIFLRVYPSLIVPSESVAYWDHWGRVAKERENNQKEYNRITVYDPDIQFISKHLLIKSLSFRNKKKDRAIRTIFLGDSITALNMYSYELEKKIRKRASELSLDFLNAATCGWNTYNQRAYLEKYGYWFRPDIVLLQFHLNDFFASPVVIKQDDGSWLAFNVEGGEFIFKNSSVLSSSKVMQFLFFRSLNARDVKPTPAAVKEELAKIVAMSKKYNFVFKIIIFPYFRENTPYDEFYGNKILEICHELKLKDDVIDLRSVLGKYNLAAHQLSPGSASHPDLFLAKRSADYIAPILDDIIRRVSKNKDSKH